MRMRRFLGICLGVLWLIDGLLQAQPAMFTKAFVTSILVPAAQGQPGWLAAVMAAGFALWERNMALANSGALVIQLLIGGLLLTGWRRPWGPVGLALSVLWGIGVWVFGEGLGMLVMAGMTIFNGIPGSVLVYVAVAALLLLPERWWASGVVGQWISRALGVFWLLAALLQAWPDAGYWSGKNLAGIFQSAAGVPQPDALSAPITAVAGAVAIASMLWNGVFVAVMVAIGVAFLLGVRALWLTGLTIVWLFFIWWMGQDFGSLFSGTGTDPNTAIPLGLLTIALALSPDPQVAVAGKARRAAPAGVRLGVAE